MSTLATRLQVIDVARGAGTVVALTAGDANVVRRHRLEILDVLREGVDILFANK